MQKLYKKRSFILDVHPSQSKEMQGNICDALRSQKAGLSNNREINMSKVSFLSIQNYLRQTFIFSVPLYLYKGKI